MRQDKEEWYVAEVQNEKEANVNGHTRYRGFVFGANRNSVDLNNLIHVYTDADLAGWFLVGGIYFQQCFGANARQDAAGAS